MNTSLIPLHHAEIQKWWWIPLLRGIAAIVLALVLLWYPLKTLVALTFWMGIFWLVDGVLNVIRALRGSTGQGRTWLLPAGVIGILAGAVVLMHPVLSGLLSLNFMVALLAASMIVNGCVLALAGRTSSVGTARTRSWSSVLVGLLYVVGGVLLMMNPAITIGTLLYLFVFWAIAVGVALIAAAFAIKRSQPTA